MSNTAPTSAPAADERPDSNGSSMPDVVDQVALARLYGEPLFALPQDLYIPPDALEVFLEAFEGPLDLLLYLIRKQNFNILDIPMVGVTKQYLAYVDEIRSRTSGRWPYTAAKNMPKSACRCCRSHMASNSPCCILSCTL